MIRRVMEPPKDNSGIEIRDYLKETALSRIDAGSNIVAG